MSTTGVKSESPKSGTRGLVIKTILGLVAVGGVIAMAAVAPNAIQLLAPLTRRSKYKQPQQRYYVRTTLNKLIDRGLIRVAKSNQNKNYLEITDKGRQVLLKYQLAALNPRRPKRWDGKWRVIIFDIKEYRRHDRDQLRGELIRFGFKHLQHSVWIYPYDCAELITLLKTSFQLGKNLLYLVVELLENDRWLRKLFAIS